MKKAAALFVATGFFSGYAPFAPGTWGTLAGLAVVRLASSLSVEMQVALLVAYAALSYFATAAAIEHFRSSDPPQVVCDEVLGIWTALIFFEPTLNAYLFGFALFRLLDILKPFPIRQIEKRLKGPAGVILDDVAAGIMTKGALWLLL